MIICEENRMGTDSCAKHTSKEKVPIGGEKKRRGWGAYECIKKILT
jgi:hypothetical protein